MADSGVKPYNYYDAGPTRRRIAKRISRRKPMSAVARENLNTRTEKRYEALTESGGITGGVKGVDASDGFNRAEARIVKRARRRQKNRRVRARNAKLYDRAGIPRSPQV